MKVLKYTEFLNEKFLFGAIATIDINYVVNSTEHYYDRLKRVDNEDGKEIPQEEIESDIAKAIKIIGRRNMFDSGISWNGNVLDAEILIKNTSTNLNIILIVEKKRNETNAFQYFLTIKTVMRKKNFFASKKEKTLEILI